MESFKKQYGLNIRWTYTIKDDNKYELKFKYKPWINHAIQKSITVKNIQQDSKLDFSNYRSILLLSNIEKTLEKLMPNKIFNFLRIKKPDLSTIICL